MTVSKGLDPTVGYLHASRSGRLALVYDLMEPLRPRVDRLLLDFIRTCTLASDDFILETSGLCRLHPQVARHVAQLIPSDAVVSESIVQTRDLLLL